MASLFDALRKVGLVEEKAIVAPKKVDHIKDSLEAISKYRTSEEVAKRFNELTKSSHTECGNLVEISSYELFHNLQFQFGQVEGAYVSGSTGYLTVGAFNSLVKMLPNDWPVSFVVYPAARGITKVKCIEKLSCSDK